MTPFFPPPGPEEQTIIRRATKKLKLPLVSGKASVVLLLLCFGIAAGLVVAIGTWLKLPAWIDFELMLACWWVVWIATLAHFLYHGKRVSDDHVMPSPRNWFGGSAKQSPAKGGSGSGTGRSASWLDFGGSTGGADEGCLWVLAILAAMVLLFAVAWLLLEIIIPILAVVLYGLIRGMLARVANQGHGCKGRFGPALLWGTVWATAYTAPLALVVWVVHLIVAHRASTG